MMSFCVRALALRTAETMQPVAVLTEALTMDVAGSAGHRHFGFVCAHHGVIIQRALAVCQGQNAQTPQFSLLFGGLSSKVSSVKDTKGSSQTAPLFRLFSRWGSGHRFLPAFLKRPALESWGVSHLLPKSFASPQVGCVIATNLPLNLSPAPKPRQNGVDRGQRAPIRAQVKSIFHHLVSNFGRGHGSGSVFSENSPNGIRKPLRLYKQFHFRQQFLSFSSIFNRLSQSLHYAFV